MNKKTIHSEQPQISRAEDALEKDKIIDYLKEVFPQWEKQDELEILQFPGGASNLTYQLEFSGKKLILRTAPKGTNIKGAHDMNREFKVLSKLRKHFSYCPKALAYSDDLGILDRPFYIMEKIEGLIPRKEMPIELEAEQLQQLCKNLIDIHLDLHAVDINKTGLIELGKPEGYVSRQVSGWCGRYENARTEDVPQGATVMNWLKDNQPEDSFKQASEASFIHNDYKFDNVVLDINNPTKIISVLDWEMATVGDPLMDLGCSLAYWIEANDSIEMQMIRMLPTQLKSMMTRDQIVDYYLHKSGITTDNFNYYYVFGLFRLAVIVQQIYKRYKEGKTTNTKFSSFGKICTVLLSECKKYY